MKTVTLTHIKTGKVEVKTFKTKGQMRRFLSNNYTEYTWTFN